MPPAMKSQNNLRMKHQRAFINGFLIGLLISCVANAISAHLLSTCGLLSLFGLDPCVDDMSRVGFPFVFFEVGGFFNLRIFNFPMFLIDTYIWSGSAIISGFVARKIAQKRELPI